MKKILIIAVAVAMTFGMIGLADGALRVTFSWPTHIDPSVGSDFSSSSAFVNLYDTLVYPTASGDPIPHVATSWDVTEDSLQWTFHLRDDVYFHDGTKLTANDVKYSMDRLTTIGEGYGFLFIGRIASTEVIDETTVRFNLAAPFGPFLSTLYRLYIVNKALVEANTVIPGAYGDFGDYGKTFLVDNDAGSGPYIVQEFRVEEELVMTKNQNYWLDIDEDAPDEVRFIGTTETATVRTMMARGELEISDQWQTSEAIQALDAMDGIDISAFSPGTIFYMMINTKLAPTDDIHFRRAMAYATDYNTVITYIFPDTFQARGPVPQNIPGADPTVFQYQLDLDKAREELGLPGQGPHMVVTDRCVFGFDGRSREMVLKNLHPGVELEEVQAEVSWELNIDPDLDVTQAPTEQELRLLREELDPQGLHR